MSERTGMKEKLAVVGIAALTALGATACKEDSTPLGEVAPVTTLESTFEFNAQTEYDGLGHAKITYSGNFLSPRISYVYCRGTLMVDKGFADDGPEITPGTEACLDGFLDVGELEELPAATTSSTLG